MYRAYGGPTVYTVVDICFFLQIMSIYIHLFVFIGVNIVLQLFVGIVVNNYNEHKPNHSALLTVSQKRWSDLVERISLTRPIKKPPVPRTLSGTLSLLYCDDDMPRIVEVVALISAHSKLGPKRWFFLYTGG